jgi:hypothetical protein
MTEWPWPFLSRILLRTLSALLTICLLVQFFIAGMAAMTDPGWWTYHSAWVAIFQWLVIPLSILAWLGGPAHGRAPYLRRPSYDWSGPARLNAGLLLLIAAGLAVRLTKLTA